MVDVDVMAVNLAIFSSTMTFCATSSLQAQSVSSVHCPASGHHQVESS